MRYLRLWLALARFGLIREMAFRGNYLMKILVELLWFLFLVVFYEMIFSKTQSVAGWSREQYLFFVGCHYALAGVFETLFLGNCNEFADLVRSGDLDFYLLQPIDEQFLVSCRNVDWSTVPNIALGGGMMAYALIAMEWPFEPLRLLLFMAIFGVSVTLAYSFMLLLTSSSVWLLRNQSLYEMWWLCSTLMRYPREIFERGWVLPFGWFFTYIVPIMLVVSVPASTMVRVFEPGFVLFMLLAAVVMLAVSRQVFRLALRRYRSASS